MIGKEPGQMYGKHTRGEGLQKKAGHFDHLSMYVFHTRGVSPCMFFIS